MFNDHFGKLRKRVVWIFFLKWDFGRKQRFYISYKTGTHHIIDYLCTISFFIQLYIMAGLNFSETLYGDSWCLKHYYIPEYPLW